MIISELYGPQFDRTDGTVGKIQLVKRWYALNEDEEHVTPRQGRYSRATKEECQKWIDDVIAANSPDRLKQFGMVGMHPVEFWCWPNPFDPVGTVEEPEEFSEFLKKFENS